MSHPDKDTFRQFHAGASVVFINDSSHFSLQGRGESFTLEKEFSVTATPVKFWNTPGA